MAQASRYYDKNFILRLQAGDREAWKTLYDNYAGELAESINASLRKRELSPEIYADEIAQETWERCMLSIGDFDAEVAPEKIERWVRVVAFNRVRALVQSLKRQHKKYVDKPFEDLTTEVTQNILLAVFDDDINLSPENKLVDEENLLEFKKSLELTLKAWQNLPERDRNIAWRRWVEKESTANLAQEYSVSPQAISRTLTRAKKNMRGYFSRHGGTLARGTGNV